jgi:hypothetical protein
VLNYVDVCLLLHGFLRESFERANSTRSKLSEYRLFRRTPARTSGRPILAVNPIPTKSLRPRRHQGTIVIFAIPFPLNPIANLEIKPIFFEHLPEAHATVTRLWRNAPVEAAGSSS